MEKAIIKAGTKNVAASGSVRPVKRRKSGHEELRAARGSGDFVLRLHGAKPASSRKGRVVRQYIFGSTGIGKTQAISALIRSLKSGLAIEELDVLQSHLDLPMEKLAPMLGISKATLHRRKASGRLDPSESDRVVRFARLLGRAASVMESIEDGRRWLTAPQIGLGGAVPLEFAETEVGAREVENLLGRIEYGVYS